MSAAPLPTPDPEPAHEPAATDADGWALLEALRRRIDDQSAQGRKTQLQVTQLAESIGALVESQRRRERSLNLNSFVAYLIFTLLVGTGFYVLYRSRATDLVDARNGAQRERDQAVRRADEATTQVTAREQADGRAWEVYQLLEAGKRSEAVGKLATLAELPLSRTERAVLAARAHETQVMEVDAALKAAAAAFKAGRFADVIAPLEAALVGEPAGARSSSMHYYLGVAYAKANDLVKAINHLQVAIVADGDHDDARFQLASALDRSGQYARARGEYNRFATAHPQSSLAVFAMRRSGTLARMPAVAPQPPAPAPANAAPITKPAPTGAATPGAITAPAPTGAATPAPAGASPVPKAAPAKAPARVWKPKAKPAPAKPAPAKPAPAKPVVTEPVPPAPTVLDFSPVDSPTPEPQSSPAIDRERPRTGPAPGTSIDSEPPRSERPSPSLPSTPNERTPAPWPQPEHHEKPRAPESPKAPTPAPVEPQPLSILVAPAS
jgi:tetratricopeptide (TPR) repeat protein